MPYPTVDEFKNALQTAALEELVQEHIFSGVPFVFRHRPLDANTLVRHLRSHLPLSEADIIVVGSAKIGFSLGPDTFPRQFSDDSDIDVAVANEELFDQIWSTMLRWNYPRRNQLYGLDLNWIRKRMTELYWGWFRPETFRFDGLSLRSMLNPLRDVSTQWFNAFQSLSHYPEFSRRTIEGRLYRNWDKALLYHAEGLRQIKESLATE
jgi:hypothetical protein